MCLAHELLRNVCFPEGGTSPASSEQKASGAAGLKHGAVKDEPRDVKNEGDEGNRPVYDESIDWGSAAPSELQQ